MHCGIGAAAFRPIRIPRYALVLAVIGAYSNSFAGPFVFDDLASITDNPTIRRLWPLAGVWHPPVGGQTVAGRPLLNLSFALNYAAGGAAVRGYHLVNLIIHVLATLTLYGIAWRTLEKTKLGVSGETAKWLGFAIALLWALHPLQTESVTYVVQRAESLMGLFFLLTLYGVIRGLAAVPGLAVAGGADSGDVPAAGAKDVLPGSAPPATARQAWPVPVRMPGSATPATVGKQRAWFGFSVVMCLCGVATKEVMVVAPVMVLLYDRTFAAGTFGRALRTRTALYAGLFAAWLPLAWLVHATRGRGNTAGLGMGWEASLVYARAQFGAVLHYLRLAVWPQPLVFDYGTGWAHSGAGWVWPALGVAVLIAATVYGLWRRSGWGFLGAWFLVILAPTSSVVPIATEERAEHRMYLALAAVVAGFVIVVAAALRNRTAVVGRWGTGIAIGAVALALGAATYARNEVYRSDVVLWTDTVAKRPENFSARNNLGLALEAAGQPAAAAEQYQAALQIDPDNAKVHNNYGRLLLRAGKRADAANQFHEAMRSDPDNAEAHNNFGVTLAMSGRMEGAISEFQRALAIKPDYQEAHENLARATRQVAHRAP